MSLLMVRDVGQIDKKKKKKKKTGEFWWKFWRKKFSEKKIPEAKNFSKKSSTKILEPLNSLKKFLEPKILKEKIPGAKNS